ncbi:MAG: helix-turn-helix domain-containing protein [Hyphomicrobiales bacterium]
MRKTTTFRKTQSDTPILPKDSDAVDPDNVPLSPELVKKLRRVPRVRTLRRALQLTQEQFAERFDIPIGTLRDWEQQRSEPDSPARVYLKVIASDPELVRNVLQRSKLKP